MYEFVTHTWNTIKGKCHHDCSYCYMKRWKNQREIRFDENELKTNLGTGNFIFVGSSNDMFAENIDPYWIEKTLIHCNNYDNKYLFQSKNPKRFYECAKALILPENSIFCVTIESCIYYTGIMGNAPMIQDRLKYTQLITENIPVHITIEPILDFDIEGFVKIIRLINPTQINIGADSGHHKLPEPRPEKIKDLIDALHNLKIKTVLKKNLKRLYNHTL